MQQRRLEFHPILVAGRMRVICRPAPETIRARLRMVRLILGVVAGGLLRHRRRDEGCHREGIQ